MLDSSTPVYRLAAEEFERLKALRHELPKEPIFKGNPNQTKPLASFTAEPTFTPERSRYESFPTLDTHSLL
jgi:hypothetical protein